MKCILFLAAALFMVGVVAAQTETQPLKGFVFPEFVKGEIVMKNGGRNFADINYDTYDHRILFKSKEGDYIALGGLNDIVMVIIDKRVFVPIGGEVFYEEIPLSNGNRFYVEYRNEFKQNGAPTPFGGSSQASASKSVRPVAVSNSKTSASGMSVASASISRNALGEDTTMEDQVRNIYYVKDGVNFKQIVSIKSLTSLFKPHKSKIETFVKDNNIQLTAHNEVVKLLEYCYSL